jgi:hypothetical protein
LLDAVASQIPVFGRVFVVQQTTDAANYHYQGVQQTFKTDDNGFVRSFTDLATAYAAVGTNENDVIALDAVTSHSLTAMLTVAKNRVHFLGMDSGGRINSQGAKITLATAVATDTAVIKNTGVRNTFRNLKIIMAGTNAAQVNAMDDSGEGTFAENCHFSHITLLSTAGVSALKFGGDTCHYRNCNIGDATVYRTGAAQMSLRLAQYARYSVFENCTVVNYSSQTTAMCMGCDTATAVIGYVRFKECTFINVHLGDGATAGATFALNIVSALSSGYILLDKCASFGATAFASAHASILNAGPASAAAGAGGLATAGA